MPWCRRAGAARCRRAWFASTRPRRMSGSSAAPRPTGRPTTRAVNKIQAGFKITPLSRWGKAAEPVVGTVDPGVDMKTPPKITVDTMPAGKFFAYAAEILKLQPPHITDQPILAQMQRIGIERGKSFDIDKVDPAIKAGLETAPEDALKLMAWKVAQPRPRRKRLVDEHRHDGCLRQLLPEARDRHPAWSRREPAGGRDLSAQPRGRDRQAAGWRATPMSCISRRVPRRR